jgi:hypothetical protein
LFELAQRGRAGVLAAADVGHHQLQSRMWIFERQDLAHR